MRRTVSAVDVVRVEEESCPVARVFAIGGGLAEMMKRHTANSTQSGGRLQKLVLILDIWPFGP